MRISDEGSAGSSGRVVRRALGQASGGSVAELARMLEVLGGVEPGVDDAVSIERIALLEQLQAPAT
jgi:hypothetical protein